jgi:agmatine/peptidylarginine deiminase
MAEWEEMQAIVITWTAFTDVLTEIVRYAKEEVEVIIVARDNQVTTIENTLTANDITMDNVTIVTDNYNSIWVRDYGANPVYANDVDSLILIDWIYNRNRPRDDTIPETIANYFDVPIYNTTAAPMDLVNTGGNFMSDGLGTAFASKLVLEENGPSNIWGESNHTEEDVDQIMYDFMGIDEYIKMDVLPYDGINHIDMHMKLLDEQTLLIGDFLEGISDGPQLEANLLYVLDNFKTAFDTDFRVERIIQPPCGNGSYPPNCSNAYEYRTYTNALFVNKTILVPIYNTQYDDEALAKWAEMMPGYKIRGIDCTQIINSGGAIHCITKEVGVQDPLWIAHGELPNLTFTENTADYVVDAKIKHRSGIGYATLSWTIDTLYGYAEMPMTLTNLDDDIWSATIPNQADGSEIFYYITAEANSGKMGIRPIVAPAGYFKFEINEVIATEDKLAANSRFLKEIFPNPATSTTVIPVNMPQAMTATIVLKNMLGQTVKTVFNGNIPAGESNYFINVKTVASGNYVVVLEGENGRSVQKLVIR